MKALRKLYSAALYLSFMFAIMSILCKVFDSAYDVYQMQNNLFVLLFMLIVLLSAAMTVLLHYLWKHVSQHLK